MPFTKGHTLWKHPNCKKNQFKKGQVSPRKGRASNKPAWNKGLKRTWESPSEFKNGQNAEENHPNWKGGISKTDKTIRRMKEYLDWREKVFKRDNFTCQKCGVSKVYVTAHHIKAFAKILKEYEIKNVSDARKCDELWDISNGQTLCESCHEKTDNYRGRAKKVQGKKRG